METGLRSEKKRRKVEGGEGMEIPEPMAMEILSRLPVKSLTRFRCVCKPWASTFHTSYFITKHRDNYVRNNTLCLLVNDHNVDIHYLSPLSTEKGLNFVVTDNIGLPFFENPGPLIRDSLVRVYGSCNGLLCLGNYVKHALWNPSTREFKIIPKFTFEDAFEVGVGFGFDSTTHDFKVVSLASYRAINHHIINNPPQAGLYSLKSDSWKKIPNPNIYGSFVGNYVNGFYYWLAGKLILSFDMASEKFSTLPLPISGKYLKLVDFNGLLGVISGKKSLDLWVMNGSWTKQLSVESVPGVSRLLAFWENGEFFAVTSNHELVLFDPTNREVKNLGINFKKCWMHQLVVYVESLVQINGRSEREEIKQ